MTIIGILDILYTRLEKKIKLEENEAYQDKCKVIKRIRMVVFIIYMVCGIYFVLHH
ncbi:hypothetical protein [Romboutsia sp.]|uniref:hypothetical protein n=1 Tax=Romboutsia sp. TaxID=1965302 RepID=UPI003F662133